MANFIKSVVGSAVCATAALTLCSGAFAADLPTRKAPPPPPVVVAAGPNWGGFYIGVSGGANWTNTNWNTTALGPGFTATFLMLDGR